MNKYHNNFKGASWYEYSEDQRISVLGAGGIGSNLVFNLSRTVLSDIFLFDFDKVEEHNIGSQFFTRVCEGGEKVYELAKLMEEEFGVNTVRPLAVNINEFPDYVSYILPITVAAFDNMEARKKAFNDWQSYPDRQLFIDGRLRATEYEIFCVTPGLEDEYRKTLFDSSDVPDDPCTFKQTTYAGMMIGARITSFITNHFYNKHSGEEVCSVPFHFKELLELNYIEIKEPKDVKNL